jgi:hypothetical protein
VTFSFDHSRTEILTECRHHQNQVLEKLSNLCDMSRVPTELELQERLRALADEGEVLRSEEKLEEAPDPKQAIALAAFPELRRLTELDVRSMPFESRCQFQSGLRHLKVEIRRFARQVLGRKPKIPSDAPSWHRIFLVHPLDRTKLQELRLLTQKVCGVYGISHADAFWTQ